ncbi:hypothetical protein E2562_025036 [Oryza meyeriana var. granulata]|uniref:Uncharacterized protein n=1 Tax=Oryza meyeriana var. granulata TaxID=110450 RepID=A0A6G1D6C1_9ORYZ|nr:hypothetical protein E2562_025036 [Oryza meyeriana var. granulata]
MSIQSIEGSDMLFGLYATHISFSLQLADSYKENHPMLEHHRLMAILSFRKMTFDVLVCHNCHQS